MRSSLRDHRFAALLVAEAVNSIGSWASAIAPWGFAAYRFDASPGQISLLIICWSVPSAVLSPFLGVLVDRLGNRRAVIAAYVIGAGAAGCRDRRQYAARNVMPSRLTNALLPPF